ncbi:hypothetical protein ACFSTC_62145 [Nonomuraea ferruginea]
MLSQERPVEGRAVADRLRDGGSPDAEGAQHRLQRPGHGGAVVGAGEADVELAVRERARELMRHVQGERGLADPAHAGDRADRQRLAPTGGTGRP